jgi:superfamily I DNA/RNA helicase
MHFSRDRIDYYIDKQKRLYHNRVAKLLEQYSTLSDINMRIEKYFDNIFIDEVQDFAGHDFNLLRSISQSDVDIIMVGDFFQHTYDTSRDGTVNKNLHSDYHKYLDNFRTIGFNLDLETLNKSYRCSPAICKFISDNIGIEIDSHRHDETLVYLIEDENEIKEKLNSRDIVKLFYQGHHKFLGFSQNWGASKGIDHYKDVCVVLNKRTFDLFKTSKLHELNPQTRNKLYVACSRARQNLYFVPESQVN